MIKPGPVVVSGTAGAYKPVSGASPAGWNVWASDGRIVPPPGLYRVTTTAGVTLQKRTAGGSFVPAGDLVRISAGEAITPNYRDSEDYVMVENVSPPPYFVERLRRWGRAWVGGRCGAETRETGSRCVSSARRKPRRSQCRGVAGVVHRSHLPTRGNLLGGVHRGRELGEAWQRDGENHRARATDVRRRRPPAVAVHARRASNPRHTRVGLAGGEHGGA